MSAIGIITLTQLEIVDALVKAAANKAQIEGSRIGRIATYGKAWEANDGRMLLVFEVCEAEVMPQRREHFGAGGLGGGRSPP